jgi:hypothetical protein
MNEEDLRDCFAMFRAATGATPEECYRFAEEMLEARKHKEEAGLPAIRRRVKKGE